MKKLQIRIPTPPTGGAQGAGPKGKYTKRNPIPIGEIEDGFEEFIEDRKDERDTKK